LKRIFSGKQDVYIEIAERYKEYIDKGILSGGEKLPSVREAACSLGVNPNTVAKAYARLEEEGYIVTLPKKGAYVKGDEEITGTYINNEEKDEKERHVSELILSLKDEGVEKDALLKIIEEVYR
jgi:GntR family transcriptional regulator